MEEIEIKQEHKASLLETATVMAPSPENIESVYLVLEKIYQTAYLSGFNRGLKKGVEIHKEALRNQKES